MIIKRDKNILENENELFINFRERNDEKSFELLFKMTETWLFKFIHRLVADKSATNDIIQETWLKLMENMYNFDCRKGYFRNYIFKIAKNLVLKWNTINSTVQVHKDYFLDKEPTPIQKIETAEKGEILRKAISQIRNKDYQDTILMYYFAGISTLEIADYMDTSNDNVKNWLKRGRRELKKIFLKNKELNSIIELGRISLLISLIFAV